jgi:hypothetical protein
MIEAEYLEREKNTFKVKRTKVSQNETSFLLFVIGFCSIISFSKTATATEKWLSLDQYA